MKNFTPFCRRLITSLFLFTIAASSWAYDFEVDGIYYNKTSDSTVAVTSGTTNYTNDIIIPKEVTKGSNTYTVTAIASKAFFCCYSLNSVTIPNSVTSIGDYAFNYSSLTSITIPNGVTSIGFYAFSGTDLTSITIPNSVTNIKDATFSNCSSLKSVTIPYNVTGIGYSAFSNCSALTSVTIPNNVKYIMNSAFKGCSGLKEFHLLSSHVLSYLKAFGNYGLNCTVYVPYKDVETARTYYTGNILPEEPFYPKILSKTANSITFEIHRPFSSSSSDVMKPIGSSIVKLEINGVDMNIKDSVYVIQCDEPYTNNEVYIKYDTGLSVESTAPGHVSRPVYQDLYFTLTSAGPEFTVKPTEKKQGRLAFSIQLDCSVNTADYKVGCMFLGENGEEYILADKDDCVSFSNLYPNKSYTIIPYVNYNDKTVCGEEFTSSTNAVSLDWSYKTTQSTISITPSFTPELDGTVDLKIMVEKDGTQYEYKNGEYKFSGLPSNRSFKIGVCAILGDKDMSDFVGHPQVYVSTKSINPNISRSGAGPTTLSLQGSYTLGDATLDKAYFSGYEDQGEKLQISGLIPGKTYSYTFYVKTKEGSTESITKSFTTPALEWETLPAEATSNTVALICAKTNIADEETGTGFEWRRYDAPDLVPSTKAPCPVVDGVLTGALRNLSANTYYKFRPYYTSAAGQTYYGDWLAFGTADAYVYFDPTVRTYEASTVSHNSAKLKGYAIAGSDDIVEQGFEYRTTGRSTAPLRILATNAEGDDVQSVIATGQWMNVTLDNLRPGTTYTYRAYVKTAKATTYGEEQSFTTMEVSGIGDMDISEDVTITAIYTLDGRRIASLQPGVNIVHYSNGSVRKMIVK